MMFDIDVLAIGISIDFHNFSGMAIDDSLTLEFEDLPPLTTGSVDLQVSRSSIVLDIE
jgi:hypothetical protein